MIRSCSELADDTVLRTDVCIVGGGPAGLSLANSLVGAPFEVLVLEAGGAPGRPIGLTESSVAASEGDLEPPLRVPSRLGGGANEWIVRLRNMRRGVRMLPLSAIDLDARPWVPESGWPIEWSELERYYARADDLLELGERGYDLDRWEGDRRVRLPLESHGFTTAMERFASPAVFKERIPERLSRSSNVGVLLDAPVGAIDGTPRRATHVMIDHGRAGRVRVEADTFVLATGGIDNARLLLAARDRQGFADSGRVVGRYFVDHHRIVTGHLRPANTALFAEAGLYDLTGRAEGAAMGKVTPTADLLRSHGLLHSGSMLLPKPSAEVEHGLGLLRELIRRRTPPNEIRRHAVPLARTAAWVARTGAEMAVRQRRFPPSVDAGWSGLSGRPFDRFMVETQIELAPDSGNRLRLGASVDRFGRPCAEMAWRWTDLDLQSLRATTALLAAAVRNSGVGTFEAISWDDEPALTTPNGAFHPSGTTRMGGDRSTSVTDHTGRVHDVDNVYVAGSSLFPTVGYANPTLTIVALAIRLGDHLRGRPAAG